MSDNNSCSCCPAASVAAGMTAIHPAAIIEPGAQLGVNVTIGPYTVIERDVEIGDGTEIGPHAMICNGARIGPRCRIFQGASIGQEPQDKKYAGEKTLAVIGEETLIREYATINRGTAATGETRVGKRGWIMAYCHIAHDCSVGDDATISNALAMAGHVTVGNGVTISGVVTINQFVRIGDYAMVGARARVASDIVPYALVGTEPMRIVSINKVGLERRGFTPGQINNIKSAYKILFRDGLSLNDALTKINTDFPDDENVKNLTGFVKGSEKGFLRMRDD
ncbi:MAG: acyl-ACP--UDP-N-acetylglucosamine O-acyltransferase [Chitinispirillia bacterium]|nr:acyl-ACP--UDP-N-acetylglucosamine O-acyltransferase [Chitinispirillia bacterium]MCL2241174.1 acyl-ACP--UDP-N-acetylglucosamine O-acyltransferase [Chitinispirillia bacterium]